MESPQEYNYQQYASQNSGSKVRDIEDKLNLLKNRINLIGQSYVGEREKSFNEIQELKKAVIQIKEEHVRILELLQRITEQINNSARKEEFAMLQRQLDILRK
ncbi:MAG: hypothetical protein AABX83_01975 [Nanoarchaeota archaeon]